MAESPIDANEPHLVVDARPLNGGRNGIARVVDRLLAHLPGLTDIRITALSNRRIIHEGNDQRVTRLVDRKWKRIPGNAWLTLRVPSLLAEIGATHFLGTQHMLPLRRAPGVHYGVLMHDVVHLMLPQSMQWSNRLTSRLLFARSYAIADSVAAVSQTTAGDLCRHLGARNIRVIYPGVESAPSFRDFAPARDHRRPWQLLFVGSLEPRKNLVGLLDAFIELNRGGHRANLVICSGGQWGAGEIEQRLRRLDGTGSLCVMRNVTDEQLRAFYDAGDALVLPSLYEGFGLPLLESLGRTAVIANRIPVFEELAAHLEGLDFVDFSATPEQMSRELLAALERSAPPLRLRAETPADLFSWQRFTAGILESLGLRDPQGSLQSS